ncbi:MAG TPA: lysophospholipid acyltransferase family protein [Mycobacteriales bacterium]|nr:lysophospholipid acyltransferase family protein [Mycobacteriales bacterium]
MTSLVKDVKQLSRGWRWSHRPLPPRSAEAHHTFAPPSEFPTDWARSRPARLAREVILRAGLGPVVRHETTLRIEGLDVFDALDGPVIFVANHSSHLDTALLLTTLPVEWQRKVAVGAAADYFFDAWWRAVGSALAFSTFPIERGGEGLSDTPSRLLADGWSLVMFPEGTRSPDGWTRRFRLGAAYLAATAGVPVVPVGLVGSYAAMPRGRGWPKPGRPEVHVRYGPALTLRPDEDSRRFGARISAATATLLDEDRTDWYGAQRRAAAGETPSPSGPQVANWRRVWESSASPRSGASRAKAWR